LNKKYIFDAIRLNSSRCKNISFFDELGDFWKKFKWREKWNEKPTKHLFPIKTFFTVQKYIKIIKTKKIIHKSMYAVHGKVVISVDLRRKKYFWRQLEFLDHVKNVCFCKSKIGLCVEIGWKMAIWDSKV
jgi:hypothetical protein